MNIKLLSFLSIFSLIITSYGNINNPNSQKQLKHQIIELDDKHNHGYTPEGEEKLNYTIHSETGLIIDATKYNFILSDQFKGKTIDLVQVIIDGNVYQTNWSKNNLTTLNKDNLKLIWGDKEFIEFKEGQTIIVGIGIKQENLVQLGLLM